MTDRGTVTQDHAHVNCCMPVGWGMKKTSVPFESFLVNRSNLLEVCAKTDRDLPHDSFANGRK